MTDHSEFACPACKKEAAPADGNFSCPSCGRSFPVVDGVYDFSGIGLTEETRKTVSQFGQSWEIFDRIEPYHEQQFLDWISPLGKEIFRDKLVLEAGCGKGRHSFIVSSFGPKKLFSADLSEAVFIARRNVRGENCAFVRCDIKSLPFEEAMFDLVFSVGVLHHLDKPAEGLKELWRVLKPGGKLLLWVYAREGNGWILNFVNPLRKSVTSRIPAKTLRILAFPLTTFLFLSLKILYAPLTKRGTRETSFLPYSSYLGAISLFPFREIDSIVVDHLCPSVAYYLSRDEIEALFSGLSSEKPDFRWHHKNSWTVIAVKGKAE